MQNWILRAILQARTRSRKVVFWGLFALAAYLAIFHLPFLFPPSVFCLSASYSAGFNNRVASIAAVLFGIGTFAIARRGTLPTYKLRFGAYGRLPSWVLWVVLMVCAGFLFGLSACVYAFPHNYGEAALFLDRLDQMEVLGHTPFRDFEFPYGPLLLYVPTVVHWLGGPLKVSLEWSYYFSLLVLTLIGVWALFWLINEIIPGRHYKLVAFVGLAVIGLNPTMGMNYMYFRYIGPYVALLMAERFHTIGKAFVFLGIAGLLLFSISPEIGFAFSVGASLLCFCRGLHLGFRWFGCVVGAWLGPALLLAIFGPGYIRTFLEVAKGAYNFVVVPVPHILFFLAALIFAVPLGVARLPSSHWREHPALIAMLLSSVVLVPAALGRCDVGHVFWEGLGIILLSISFAYQYRPSARNGWLGLVCIVFFVGALTSYRFYARQLVSVAGAGVRAYAPSAAGVVRRLTPARLRDALADSESPLMSHQELVARVGTAAIAMPFGVDKGMAQMLKDSHLYSPSFFAGFINVFDVETEDLKITDMDKQEWALIPVGNIGFSEENLAFVRRVFSFPIRYRYLRAPYIPGKRLLAHLDSRWEREKAIDGFWLYHNRAAGSRGNLP